MLVSQKILVVGALASLTLLSGCSMGFSKFTSAYEACGSPSGVTVSDSGTTLTVDTMGEEDYSGAAMYDLSCVVDELQVPQYIRDNLNATTALMGRQSAEFEGISMNWSYHPDSGANVTFHYGN